jgi:hypothetical protein
MVSDDGAAWYVCGPAVCRHSHSAKIIMNCAICNAEIPAGRTAKTCGAIQCARLFSLKRKAVVEKSPEWAEKTRHKNLARPKLANCSSVYRGVTREGNKWRADCAGYGYLGVFVDPVDAAKAYDAKAFELWGDKATLNFPAL